jgi:hypothetical protein
MNSEKTYGFHRDTDPEHFASLNDQLPEVDFHAPGDPVTSPTLLDEPPEYTHEIRIACEFFEVMSSMNDTQREFIMGTVRGMMSVEASIEKI